MVQQCTAAVREGWVSQAWWWYRLGGRAVGFGRSAWARHGRIVEECGEVWQARCGGGAARLVLVEYG